MKRRIDLHGNDCFRMQSTPLGLCASEAPGDRLSGHRIMPCQEFESEIILFSRLGLEPIGQDQVICPKRAHE